MAKTSIELVDKTAGTRGPKPREWEALVSHFWTRVSKSPGYGPNGDCWLWSGSTNKGGYGDFRYGRRHHMAHRFAFEVTHGRKPNGNVLHTCDNPPCCNPAHLFEGSQADNLRDCRAKGRAFHKLTDEQVAVIRSQQLLPDPPSYASLARIYGVTRNQIRHVALGIQRLEPMESHDAEN